MNVLTRQKFYSFCQILNHNIVLHSQGWNTLHDFCTDFCPNLQSGRINTSCWKSSLIWRFWAVRVDRFHRKSRSVSWAQTHFFLALDFNSIHLEDIKHVWYFDLILEQIVLICLVSPINKVHVFGSVLCLEQQQEKSIMPSVLKSYNKFFLL